MGRFIPFILILHIYALVDCLQTNHAEVPGRIPRALWALLTLVPIVGPVVWLGVHWVGYQEAKARRQETGDSGPQLRGFPTLSAKDLSDGASPDFPSSSLTNSGSPGADPSGFTISGRIRSGRTGRGGPIAPDDNPEFLAELAAQQRRREARNTPSAPSAHSSASAPTPPNSPASPSKPVSSNAEDGTGPNAGPNAGPGTSSRPGDASNSGDSADPGDVDNRDEPEDPTPPLAPA